MMEVTYSLELRGKCPVDGTIDRYETVITTRKMIKVENILELVTLSKPEFQEDLTQRLANTLGAKVVTTGIHSGVQTVCTAEPEPIVLLSQEELDAMKLAWETRIPIHMDCGYVPDWKKMP